MVRSEHTKEAEARDQVARRAVQLSFIAVGTAALVVLLWYIGDALLIIFAGMLLAVFLDAAVAGLGRLVHADRPWRFGAVLLLFALILVASLSTFGILAAQQLVDLLNTLDEQVQQWRSTAAETGLGRLFENKDTLATLLPDPGGLLSRATTAVTSIFGVIGSSVLIVMLGIFLAYDPLRYRDGVLLIIPPDKRSRMREVLTEAGGAMRWWLLGIAINMVVIGVFTTLGLILIGVPHAVVLGVQAGLLAFIPTLGPVLAAIPIILVSVSQGVTMLLWALGLYLAVQTLESNVLTPLVQMEMVRLYPGTILIVQLIMLALYGFLGVALATPLAAVGKVLIRRLYVEDTLGARTPSG